MEINADSGGKWRTTEYLPIKIECDNDGGGYGGMLHGDKLVNNTNLVIDKVFDEENGKHHVASMHHVHDDIGDHDNIITSIHDHDHHHHTPNTLCSGTYNNFNHILINNIDEQRACTRRTQIAFFDLETTVASGDGDKPKVLEFGAVVLSPLQGLRELESYSTMVRHPGIFYMGAKFNLAQHRIVHLPSFNDIADHVFDMLHGRIWAGHNIIRWDMVWIKEAFIDIGRKPPEPSGVIDTLPLLREAFGQRAGNLKLESLAKYCGLGKQKHRSIADVRMNIDVLKHCATILFLESRFPHILEAPKQLSTRRSTRLMKGHAVMGEPSTSRWKPKWDQAIQSPSPKNSTEMKRVSPIRFRTHATSSSNSLLRRQPQLAQYVRGRSRTLAIARLTK